jgi:hypothetical protein
MGGLLKFKNSQIIMGGLFKLIMGGLFKFWPSPLLFVFVFVLSVFRLHKHHVLGPIYDCEHHYCQSAQ